MTKVIELRDSDYLLIAVAKTSLFLFDRINNTLIRNLLNFELYIKDMLQLKSGMIAIASINPYILILDPSKNFSFIREIKVSEKIKEAQVNTLLELKESGFLLTGSFDGIIKVWDPYENFTNIVNLTGHLKGILKLHEMVNGNILSSSQDSTIKIWDLKIQRDINGKYYISNKDKEFNIHTLIGHNSAVKSAIQHSQSKLIISGSFDSSLKIWDPFNNYTNIFTLNDQSYYISSITELRNGYIATISTDRKFRIWDPLHNFDIKFSSEIDDNFGENCIIEFQNGIIALCNKVNDIQLMRQKPNYYPIIEKKDTRYIYSHFADLQNGYYAFSLFNNFVNIVDSNNNLQIIKQIEFESNYISGLIRLNNGNLLIASLRGKIEILDIKQNIHNIIFEDTNDSTLSKIAELDNGIIGFGFINGTIIARNSNDFKTEFTLESHNQLVICMKQLKDGYIVSTADDSMIIIWNPALNNHPVAILKVDSPADSIIELPNGDLASGHRTGSIIIWKKIEINETIENNDQIFERQKDEKEAFINSKNLINNRDKCMNNNLKKFKFQFYFKIDQAHENSIHLMTLIKNKFIVTASFDNLIKFWDITHNFSFTLTIKDHKTGLNFMNKLQDESIITYDKEGNLKIWSDTTKYKCIKKMEFDRNSSISFLKVQNLPILYKLEKKSKNKEEDITKINPLIPEYYMSLGIKSQFSQIIVFEISIGRFIKIQVSEKPISTYEIISFNNLVYIIFGFIDGSIKISLFTNLNLIKERFFLSKVHRLAITNILPYINSKFITCSDDGFISLWDLNEPYQEIYSISTEKNRKIFKCFNMKSPENRNLILTLGYSSFSKWKIEDDKIFLLKTYYLINPKKPIYEVIENCFGTLVFLTEEKLFVYNSKFELINSIEMINGKSFKTIINLKYYKLYPMVSYTAVGIDDGSILIFEDIEIKRKLIKKFLLIRGFSVLELYESQMGYLFSRYSDWTINIIYYRNFD